MRVKQFFKTHVIIFVFVVVVIICTMYLVVFDMLKCRILVELTLGITGSNTPYALSETNLPPLKLTMPTLNL